jgi:DNA-binding transcriptional MerR regulator
MTETQQSFTISQVAELTGLSTHTLRYYESAGLMRVPIDRASSSHRRYVENDVTWIRFLTKLRSTAMPIALIREYAQLASAGDSTEQARLDLLVTHRMSVLAQLDDITQSLAAIDFKIATYRQGIATS